MKRGGKVRVDLSNKSAEIRPDGGGPAYLYGPGVTRRNVEPAIAKDGWKLKDGTNWELMDPPDGFERDVEQDGSEQ